MAEKNQVKVEGNKCICLNITCDKTTNVPCSKNECTTCRSCCDANCKRCDKKCEEKNPCKCHIVRCGCEQDCYKDGKGEEKCKGKSGNCKRCQYRCTEGQPCKCHYCSCGTKCNGIICSCCSWCDPKNCSGKECNGFVIGRCKDQGQVTCQGHVKYDLYDKNDKNGKENYGAVLDRKTNNVIPCDGSHEGECKGNCRWTTGVRDDNGNCVIKCTYCGKLCGQDNFRRCCYIAVPLVITVSAFLIFRFMLPETFHKITTGIRAAFPNTSRHPGISLNNLVGDRIPEETNVDRYPEFRPRAYAGLS